MIKKPQSLTTPQICKISQIFSDPDGIGTYPNKAFIINILWMGYFAY